MHGYEQEILGVPRSPFALRLVDKTILARLKTLTVSNVKQNLQEPFRQELEAQTKTSHDLMDLGYKNIAFTFIGFNFKPKEKSSFVVPAMIVIATNKFRKSYSTKLVNMDDLGDLGDWEQFFKESQESIDLGNDFNLLPLTESQP